MPDFDRAFWDVPTVLAWIGGDVDEALDGVVRAAEAARLEVSVIPQGEGARIGLRAIDWCDLDFVEVDGEWLVVTETWVKPIERSPADDPGSPSYAIREDLNVFAGGVTWIDADYDATLAAARGTMYRQPRFAAAEVKEVFPQDGRHDAPSKTGLPGRPSLSREVYDAEFKRRCDAAALEESAAAEARYLRQWLQQTYPGAALPEYGTIRNHILDRYRDARNRCTK
jgi:hypothetical protein